MVTTGGKFELSADFQQFGAHPVLDIEAVIHQFEEVVFLAVDVLPHAGSFHCLVELPQSQAGLHIARGAAGGGNNAVGMLGDEFGVHARILTQLALVGGHGGEIKQITQALAFSAIIVWCR